MSNCVASAQPCVNEFKQDPDLNQQSHLNRKKISESIRLGLRFRICAELIAGIRRNRQQPTTEPTKPPRTNHYDWLGPEQGPWKRFVVLVAVPEPLPVVSAALNPQDHLEGGGGIAPIWKVRPRLNANPRRQRDPVWKGTPSVEIPNPNRTPWFLSEEGKRVTAARDERKMVSRWQRQPSRLFRIATKSEASRPPERKPSERKTIQLPEDAAKKYEYKGTALSDQWIELNGLQRLQKPSPMRQRDAAAFFRKRLVQLFGSKKSAAIKDVANVLAWQARGLSVREIAVEMDATAAWVRYRLDGISKNFIRQQTQSLTSARQQKDAIAVE